jgi:hypothetical protein
MNKAWITGITVASVAGTGGAAYATMQANTQHNSAAAEAPQSTELTTTTVGAQAYEFQAGPAGVVHLTANDGVLSVDSALPSVGWTLLDYTSPAAHVQVRLTDGMQIITFSGDIVNGKVTGSIDATPAPTVPTTAAPTTAAPQPAVPPQQVAPAAQPPTSAHTSAPSGSHTASGGGDDSNEHESDDSHESEHEGGGSDD